MLSFTSFRVGIEASIGDAMRFLGYLWCGAVNTFYFLVVAAVLLSINNAMEKSIISVLGLIYATIRTTAIIQGIAYSNVIAAFDGRLDKIEYHLDASFEMPDRREVGSAISYQHNKLYIELFFLSLISLA
ncbi:MAG TPA: hypothetical protein VIJ35_18140, partial [Bradyrhizobium sp.]